MLRGLLLADNLLYLLHCLDVAIFSHRDRVTIPTGFNPLSDSTFLSCGVVPIGADFTTRWITPSGGIVTQDNANSSRLAVLEGDFEVDRPIISGTAIVISNTSYQDEGIYRCEARDSSIADSPWVQAIAELELLGIVILMCLLRSK